MSDKKPSEKQEKLMLADAGLLESMNEPTSLGHDAAGYIRALLARVRELEAALAAEREASSAMIRARGEIDG